MEGRTWTNRSSGSKRWGTLWRKAEDCRKGKVIGLTGLHNGRGVMWTRERNHGVDGIIGDIVMDSARKGLVMVIWRK